MKVDGCETEELLSLAQDGDGPAIGELFERHRRRLRRMVATRLNQRVASRVDPSDVVQEAMGEASRRLPEFLRERPVPYYTWLRRLTLIQLSWLHRFHLRPLKRSALRERDLETRGQQASGAGLAGLPATDTSPSHHAIRDEECQRVRAILDRLERDDRVFLELRYVERLSLGEIANRLKLGPSAVKMRHLRALKRFRGLIDGPGAEPAL